MNTILISRTNIGPACKTYLVEAAFHSKVVVIILLFVKSPIVSVGFVFCPCLVVQLFVSFKSNKNEMICMLTFMCISFFDGVVSFGKKVIASLSTCT